MRHGWRIFIASITCGLAFYCPVLLLRGAIIGLLPGIAQKSRNAAIRGVLLGAILDFALLFFCGYALWDARDGYNEWLAYFLPPERIVMNPGSDAAKAFFPSLLLYTFMFHCLWCLLWTGELSFVRIVQIVSAGAISTACAATFLWLVAPFDGAVWHYPYHFPQLESRVVFYIAFPIAMPLNSFLVAWLLAQTPQPFPDPSACRTCSYNLTGNISGICPECGTPRLNDFTT